MECPTFYYGILETDELIFGDILSLIRGSLRSIKDNWGPYLKIINDILFNTKMEVSTRALSHGPFLSYNKVKHE